MKRQFLVQGILKIDSSVVKTQDEARELIEKTVIKALYPQEGESFTVRKVERLPDNA